MWRESRGSFFLCPCLSFLSLRTGDNDAPFPDNREDGCISYLSHCCGEYLQKQRKEQGSILLTFPGETVTGMVWEQEQEVSGHTASTVKK